MSRYCSELVEIDMRTDAVAGIVLAAGLSRRLAGKNKLLLPLGGRTVIQWTVSAYVDAGLEPVLVVVGHDAEAVRAAVFNLPVYIVENPEFALGQSRSLMHGVFALPQTVPAAVIGVGDQPRLTSSVIRALCVPFQRREAQLVVPRYSGRRGNPVLFARRYFEELAHMQGDVGGKPVLERYYGDITWADIDTPEVGLDVDTQDAYDALITSFSE